MARANLTPTDELQSQFRLAQSGGVRGVFVKLNVAAERTEYAGSLPATASAEADFGPFAAKLSADIMGAFCVDPHAESPSKHWLLVSFLPPGTPPLLRMLSASSRADIRAQLGMSTFVGEYHTTAAEELTYSGLLESQRRDATDALSEVEKRVESEVRSRRSC